MAGAAGRGVPEDIEEFRVDVVPVGNAVVGFILTHRLEDARRLERRVGAKLIQVSIPGDSKVFSVPELPHPAKEQFPFIVLATSRNADTNSIC